MDRYRVVKDLQGGEFGMGRDFTIEQWRKNALEWCYSDGNHELAEELYKLPQEEVIEFISLLWSLEFKKVRKDKKIDQSDIEAYEDETLDEFYHTRFDYTQEDEDEINESIEKEYIYKIRDCEDDDKYSQYIKTNKECRQTIQNAVEYWYDHPDDEYINADNVFDCIEQFLISKNIDFKWFRFDETNTIDF